MKAFVLLCVATPLIVAIIALGEFVLFHYGYL